MEKYFEGFVRKEIAEILPQKKRLRILDFGCSHGDTAAWLKNLGIASYAVGVELDSLAAKNAEKKLDKVLSANLDREENLDIPLESFDLILCLDVLEHLQDPWAFLEKIKKFLKSDGEIIASIPNIRNFRVLLPLLFKGEWTYTDTGILDRTHLRFFTRKTSISLFTERGFRIQQIATTGARFPGVTFFFSLLTFGILKDFFVIQYLLRVSRQ